MHPLEVLSLKGFKVSGLFYNPNIHPFLEYDQRREAILKLDAKIELICPDYLPQDFFRIINFKEDVSIRCPVCWKLRLKKTASIAKLRGFDYFTTTLLASPYQDHEALKKLGKQAAKEEGVDFYYADFRPGFRKAHDDARSKGIYMQKYCGCIYSEIERYSKKKK